MWFYELLLWILFGLMSYGLVCVGLLWHGFLILGYVDSLDWIQCFVYLLDFAEDGCGLLCFGF